MSAAQTEILLCDTSFVGTRERARRKPSDFAHWLVETLNRIDAAIVAISPFTLGEVRSGYIQARWGQARIVSIEHQLATYTLIPLDEDTVDEWSRLTAHCRTAGVTVGDNDRWIAATAISRGLPLVTCDENQSKVPGLNAIYLPADPPSSSAV